MDPEKASPLLGAMRPAEAARILAQAHARTAAGIVGVLATGPAVAPLIEAMAARSVPQVCGVLGYVSPATVSALLKSLPGGRADRSGLHDACAGAPPSRATLNQAPPVGIVRSAVSIPAVLTRAVAGEVPISHDAPLYERPAAFGGRDPN